MRVPQRVNFIVGWASCPRKRLIENDAISQIDRTFSPISITGKMPVPQRQYPHPSQMRTLDPGSKQVQLPAILTYTVKVEMIKVRAWHPSASCTDNWLIKNALL
jgi:hypothetical protein